MATIYTQTYNISSGAPLTFNIDDEYTADESYITQINSRGRHITYYSSSTSDYDVYANYSRHDSEYYGGRTALYFDPNGTSLANNCTCVTPDSNKTVVNFLFYYHVNGNFAGDYAGAVVVSGRNIQSITVTFSTNIPIFDDYTKAQNYVLNGGDYIKQALNYIQPSYFPMDQNHNGLFTENDKSFFETTFDSDNNYIFVHYYRYTRFKNCHVLVFSKDNTGLIFGELNNTGYQFSLYKIGRVSTVCYDYQYDSGNDTWFRTAVISGDGLNKFVNVDSNLYTSTTDYISNFNIYTQDGQTEILHYSAPTPPPPQIVGDKYLCAKLNMLRRRIMGSAIEPVDYSPYLNYTIADGYAWVTSVKRDEWLEKFGNLNIYIPDTIEGYPVVLVVNDGT